MGHRLTDTEIDAVLRGELPPGRDDLASVAEAVAAVRRPVSAPAPSPELAAFLGSDIPAGAAVPVSNAAATAVHQRVTVPQGKGVVAPRKRVRMFLEWIAGLGLAAKAALGTSVAVASIGTAGLAGALPESAQDAFDRSVPGMTVVDDLERDDAEGEGTEREDGAGDEAEVEEPPAVDPAQAPLVPDHASEEGQENSLNGQRGREQGQQHREEARQRSEENREEARQRSERGQERGETAREQGQQRGEEAREQAPEQGQQRGDQGQQRGEETRERAPQQPTGSEDGQSRAPEGAGSAPEEQPTRP